MGSGVSNRIASGSKKTRNFSNHHRGSKINGAGRLTVPPLLTQAKRSEERVAAQQAIAERQLEHSHLPSIPIHDYIGQSAGLGDDSYDLDVPGCDSDEDLLGLLDGETLLDSSHAGGELRSMLDRLEDWPPLRRKDTRKRRDRVKKRVAGFHSQLGPMADAFMEWWKALGEDGLAIGRPAQRPQAAEGFRGVTVLDIYSSYEHKIDMLHSDKFPSCSAIQNGLIPSAPFDPSYAVSIRALETFRATHLRCPTLTLEAFLKGLCDVYGLQYRKALQRVFSICYDVYLQLRGEVDNRVMAALNRMGNWRRKNACPACTYQLQGESKLVFSMLVTMDGNNSLKRILRRALDPTPDEPHHKDQGAEQEDTRCVTEDLYLSRDAVDAHQRDKHTTSTDYSGEELDAPAEVERTSKGKARRAKGKKKGEDEKDLRTQEEEDDPCASRWKNMKEESTERMWKLFDETGIFLCLCRHGFALTVLDMVQSGELSKYPLAVVEALLDAFGDDIGAGYDIGCKFSTTLRQSALGPRAKLANFTLLVGSFHGHAHNRLCQLSHLATYIKGLGLEDLEGCERFFSKSNALANAIRYASIFHRRQTIDQYIKHVDRFETSQSLSKFLVDNYKQALSLLDGENALRKSIASQGIHSPETTFPEWLAAEREYLKGLTREPAEETAQMEYYQSLVNWEACQNHEQQFMAATAFVQCDPNVRKGNSASGVTIARRRAAMENMQKSLERVQVLEQQMGLVDRWTRLHPEYLRAAELVQRRRYQRCLDELEGLVVSRIFELSKMNMSQTGYKLRRHIAHSLQSRSQAVKSALKRYNDAAQAFKPPRPSLTWEEVVDYAFLSDFDLLRDTRQDIRKKPWAQSANRTLMNQWFKLERAREEIQRLNIEIRRVVTHMRDEESHLLATEDELQEVNPTLAFHIKLHRLDQTRFYALHRQRFSALPKLNGFTGSLTPGTSIDPTLRAKARSELCAEVPPGESTKPNVIKSTSSDAMEIDGDDGGEALAATSSEDESDEEGLGEEELLEARFRVMEVSNM